MALILASASPRRRELLRQLGVHFEVRASEVPEQPEAGECAPSYARRVAREKALAIGRACPDAWVCAADTVVVKGGEVLGKPEDAADARRMLNQLSGASHHVLTAVVLLGPGRRVDAELVAASIVEFRTLGQAEIDAYVASGEPMDKAGAYAIQGGAAGFVTRVEGSYSNVVGLPLEDVRALLERHGLLSR